MYRTSILSSASLAATSSPFFFSSACSRALSSSSKRSFDRAFLPQMPQAQGFNSVITAQILTMHGERACPAFGRILLHEGENEGGLVQCGTSPRSASKSDVFDNLCICLPQGVICAMRANVNTAPLPRLRMLPSGNGQPAPLPLMPPIWLFPACPLCVEALSLCPPAAPVRPDETNPEGAVWQNMLPSRGGGAPWRRVRVGQGKLGFHQRKKQAGACGIKMAQGLSKCARCFVVSAALPACGATSKPCHF